jgi:hypothetical protein
MAEAETLPSILEHSSAKTTVLHLAGQTLALSIAITELMSMLMLLLLLTVELSPDPIPASSKTASPSYQTIKLTPTVS